MRFLNFNARTVYLSLVLLVTLAALGNLISSGRGFVFWPDSIGYLSPLADWQAGRGFTAWYGRSFLYPAFLALFMQEHNSYIPVLFAQIMMQGTVIILAGLLAGAVERRMKCQSTGWSLLARGVLLIGLVSFDFNPTLLGLVHTLMPETMFVFMLALQCLIVWVAIHTNNKILKCAGVAGISFFGFMLILVKPHYLLAAFVLPCAVTIMLHRQVAARYLLVAVLLGSAAAIPFHLFDGQLKKQFDPVTSVVFGPRSLFCNNLDVLNAGFERGAGDILEIRPQVDSILGAGPNGWRVLGFDGDACMYGDLGRKISSHFKGSLPAEVAYYYETYISAALRAPDMVAFRFARQVAAALALPLPNGLAKLTNDCRALQGAAQRGLLFERLLAECKLSEGKRVVGFYIKPYAFNFLFGAIFGVGLLLFLVKRKFVFWIEAGQAGSFIHVCVISLMSSGSFVVLVGLVHSFDVFRYMAIISPMIFMLFSCMTVWIFSRRDEGVAVSDKSQSAV